MSEIFNEQSLREEIAKTWGEHGAHMEVFDSLLKRAYPIIPISSYQVRVTDKEQVEYLVKIVTKRGERVWSSETGLRIESPYLFFQRLGEGEWCVHESDSNKEIISFNDFVSKFG